MMRRSATTTGSGTTGPAHRAVLCSSIEQACAEAVTRIGDAVHRRGRTVVAALRPQVARAVRSALGDLTGRGAAVTVLTPQEYRACSTDPRWGVDAGPGSAPRTAAGPWVMVDLEPDPEDVFGAGCLELEALGGRAVDAGGMELTCLYPRSEPYAQVARLCHPVLAERTVERRSTLYRRPADLVATRPELAHLHPDVAVRDVVPHVDPDLEGWIAGHARAAGLDGAGVDRAVLTVLEAARTGAESRTAEVLGVDDRWVPGRTLGTAHATSAGLPTTRLHVRAGRHPRRGGPALVCDVDAADLPPLPKNTLPREASIRALWLAAVGCRGVDVTVHPLAVGRSRIRVVASAA